MKEHNDLWAGIEDIVYAWSLKGSPAERLVDDLYDFVLEKYGPPF